MNAIWELISSDAAWDALFERSPWAQLILEADAGRVVAANTAAGKLYGFRDGIPSGLDTRELIDPGDEMARARLRSASGEARPVSGGRHRRQDGTTFHVHLHVTTIAGKAGTFLLASVADESEPDLIDASSGLADPRLFVDRLEQSIIHAHRGGRGLGVCLLIVARLEALLDDLPAERSNRLLHELGDRLRSNLRESDTVARVGKSEFAIIVEGISESDAILEVLKKALKDFEFEFSVGDEEMILEPSIGISVYPHDGHEADMLIENAAVAARAAAEDGVGAVRFYGDV